MCTQFGTHRNGCLPAPLVLMAGWVLWSVQKHSIPPLSNKDPPLGLQDGELQPDPNRLTLAEGQGNHRPLAQPQGEAPDPVVPTMLKMKQKEQTSRSLSRSEGLKK